MRNSIASLKENLSRIALDVHGDTDDDEFAGSLVGQDGPVSDRRVSQRFAQAKRSTISNGNDGSHPAQVGNNNRVLMMGRVSWVLFVCLILLVRQNDAAISLNMWQIVCPTL